MDSSRELNVASGVSLPPPPSPSRSSASQNSRSKSLLFSSRRSTRRGMAESPSKAKFSTSDVVEEPEPFLCPICFDDTQKDTLSLSCGHLFCTSCWTFYINSKIRDEGEHSIRCMATDCTLIAPDTFIKNTLGDNQVTFDRYKELIVRHFVSSNSNLKFCPYPSCTYTVSCPSAASKSSLTTIVPTVHCGLSPNHRFCFGCPIEGDHRPVICSVAKLWLKKCQDDSETANWIKTNTKECSKCQSTIEKNGGCKCVLLYSYLICY